MERVNRVWSGKAALTLATWVAFALPMDGGGQAQK